MAEVREIKLHKYQLQAITSNKRIICLVSGIQGGKTLVMILWFAYQVQCYTDPSDVFLITAPDYKIMSQATLPTFLHYFGGLGRFEQKDQIFRLWDGRPVYFRSMHEPESIQGIPRIRAIGCDEAGLYTSKAWEVIWTRSAPKQAQVFIATNPYNLGWLYTQIYKPWRNGVRQDIEVVQFRSVDNPYFPKEEYYNQQKTLDRRVFAMRFEGMFESMQGRVFMDFDEGNYEKTPGFLEVAARDRRNYTVVCGVDFGYSNPFAMAVRFIHKNQLLDVQVTEFYQSLMTPLEQINKAKEFKQRYGIDMFVCDSEEPGLIAEWGKAGLTAVGIKKYPGCVKDFIQGHNEIIKSKEYRILAESNPHTEDEYQTYHYAEPDGKDKNSPEVPVDHDNHLCSANVYVTAYTKYIRDGRRIVQPFKKVQKTHLERVLAGEFSQRPVESWY